MSRKQPEESLSAEADNRTSPEHPIEDGALRQTASEFEPFEDRRLVDRDREESASAPAQQGSSNGSGVSPADELPQGWGAGFPPTHWSLVQQAGEHTGPGPNLALEELLDRYRGALVAHVRSRFRQTPADLDIDDLVQGFLTDRVVEKGLVGRAVRGAGRFRNFIRTALDNYIRDELRRRRLPTCGGVEADWEAVACSPGPDPFDVEWAHGILKAVIQRVQSEYPPDRHPGWTVFHARFIQPCIDDCQPPSSKLLAARLGLERKQVDNLSVTVKRRFDVVVREVLAEYARDAADIEDEMRSLMEILFGNANGQIRIPAQHVED